MKKILCVIITVLLLACSFAACSGNENASVSSNAASSGTTSSGPNSNLSAPDAASSGTGSGNTNGSSASESSRGDGFLLDDFSKAYRDAGFDVSDATYGDGLKSIRVKLKEAADDIYYEIISFGNADEAKAEMDRVNQAGEKKAYVNGNALVIGEKDYKDHDQYIGPFNSIR